MQQPSFEQGHFARAKHQGTWCLLFLCRPPCSWLGSAETSLCTTVARKCCKRLGKVKGHFEGRGPVSLAKKVPQQQEPVREGDSVMLAQCLQGYEALFRANLV